LPCVTGRRTAKKKATNGAGAKRRVTAFAVRRKKNAQQSLAFVVRHSPKRATITSLCRAPPLKVHGNHCPLPCATIKNAWQTLSKKIKNPKAPVQRGMLTCLHLSLYIQIKKEQTITAQITWAMMYPKRIKCKRKHIVFHKIEESN
jgi:hypothetical protein